MATCTHAGCSGTIEDGYCNTCGMAAAGASSTTTATASTAVSASTSTRTGSGRTPSTRSARSTKSTRSTRSGSIRSGRSTSRMMGGHPLLRPPLPPMDPLGSIVAPVVPERKRFCSGCDSPLKRDSGFCAKCGQEYSFVPTLKEGDVVAGKYEVKGTVAFGGLGWIYLALDTVLNRWVILKGLLNSKDPHMLEVAVQEREYLAAVKHPNIVGIYDFVSQGTEGFIVMESVNGKTLMQLRKEANGPLPVSEAISYILEILPAFGYLDDQGLVYCDFKPDNVMVEEETVKLIDMGAVRRVDDTGGDIYGSKGYSAPEASTAPTPVSDLYTVGRALAVLVASFDFQGKHEHSLPAASECPAFQEHEALYRFLVKATRAKEEERFQTAAEMAEQLLGVLHTVVGDAGDLGHLESSIFDPDSDPGVERGEGVPSHADGIPRLRVDKEDKAASFILASGAVGDPEKRLALFARGLTQNPDSIELRLRWIDEVITLGRFDEAEKRLAEVQASHPTDWRLAWYRGRALLAQGKITETLATFESIMGELPGELGPKQAVARAHEAGGAIGRAIEYYDAVSKADGTFVSAAIGLARCYVKQKDLVAAAAAYRRVPSTSSRYAFAQTALVRVLLDATKAPDSDRVLQAAIAIEGLDGLVAGLELHKLRADVFIAAARVASTGKQPPDMSQTVLGTPFEEKDLRRSAEQELRQCARVAGSEDEKFALVDLANTVRPMSLF